MLCLSTIIADRCSNSIFPLLVPNLILAACTIPTMSGPRTPSAMTCHYGVLRPLILTFTRRTNAIANESGFAEPEPEPTATRFRFARCGHCPFLCLTPLFAASRAFQFPSLLPLFRHHFFIIFSFFTFSPSTSLPQFSLIPASFIHLMVLPFDLFNPFIVVSSYIFIILLLYVSDFLPVELDSYTHVVNVFSS